MCELFHLVIFAFILQRVGAGADGQVRSIIITIELLLRDYMKTAHETQASITNSVLVTLFK